MKATVVSLSYHLTSKCYERFWTGLCERVSLSFHFCVACVPEEVLNTNEKLNSFSKTLGIFYQPCHMHPYFSSHLTIFISFAILYFTFNFHCINDSVQVLSSVIRNLYNTYFMYIKKNMRDYRYIWFLAVTIFQMNCKRCRFWWITNDF